MKHYIFPFSANQPKYKQIYEQFKKLIEEGKLKTGENLPSIRSLANDLGVSRHTTLQAYDQLLAEGYIQANERKSYSVNEFEPIFLQTSISEVPRNEPIQLIDFIDFKASTVDEEQFPLKVWRQISNKVLQQSISFQYGDPFGEPGFKQELADYLFQARGMIINPKNIIVGSNTQQLLLYLGFLLKERFSSMIVENPGYSGVREVCHLHGFEIESIPASKQGVLLDSLVNKSGKLLYITPSHQYPTGTALSIQQRIELIQWVRSNNGFLLEDDYDGEFRYGQKPFPALASLDAAHVIYFTFSKAFLPAIRLAYMVLPDSLINIYMSKFEHFEHNASLLHQLTMTEFMKSGEWTKHIKRMRNTYKRKMNLLVQQVQHLFGKQIEIIGDNAGLYIMLRIHTPYSEKELLEKALQQHVKVYPTSHLFIENPPVQPHILLGFANLSLEQIERGICLLKEAWE
ncbi:PLP-dependent aminotransferase family protein [Bacillus altitudinis]|uniref:MocR-like pyridoxine biosynthesis transcription factor PdxR n=1 Tax=Bacillus altitudinis TaxID=293387 RepID=UPI002DBCC3F4|nr:PLP-dependent aminotransferase family protein [Bacillus altitudinis]MEC1009176.1 PLP-dependent aminotransferase family protein [Bacillus altitudinis]